MRKAVYLLITLLATLVTVTAKGQYVVIQEEESETVSIQNQYGESIVYIIQDNSSNDRMRVQVAGFEIVMGADKETPAKPAKHSARNKYKLAKPGHVGFMEVGINMLPRPNYSLYNSMTLDGYTGDANFLSLDHGQSLQWAFCLTSFSVKLTPQGLLSLSSGLQMLWNNYVFDQRVTLVKEGGTIVPKDLTSDNYKKSKISTFGFQIPILLELNLPQHIFIAGGIYGGVNLDMRVKSKFPKDIMKNPYLNPFYYGVTVRVGYHAFYVYGNYHLSRLFERDRSADVFPATIGIGFAF